MNIVFFSLKGGVGKSTLSFSVVSSLVSTGLDVEFIDYDPQESATAWLELDEFKNSPKSKFRIVDTPPRHDHAPTLKELKIADKIFIPCSMSMADIPAAIATRELIEEIAPQADIFLIWSRVDSRKKTKISGSEALAEIIGVEALKTYTRDLDCYENIGSDGYNALSASAKDETTRLALEVITK